MKSPARSTLAAVLLLATGAVGHAEFSGGVIRVGVLTDMSGVFRDATGPGSVEAARMAAEDFARQHGTPKVEIVFADHQNKPDVGSTIARQWLDRGGVDAIVDVPNSAVGLAVNAVARNTGMAFLASSTATSDLTGKACSPNTVQWVNDTWATGNATAAAMMKRGGDSWYFLTVNYALGQSIETEATGYITRHGGKVAGVSRYPLGTPDFSSLLVQAQSSGAKVIGIAGSGADTINILKQATEFGLKQNQSIIAFLSFIDEVHGMGLEVAQGLLLTDSYYWDMNDDTRAFAARFAARPGLAGRIPTSAHVGVYSATLAYLNAAAAIGSDEGKAVVVKMKASGAQDKLFGDLSIRQDGRAIHPIYLFQVKTPSESKRPYDYYNLVGTVPAEQAFRPMAEGGCPLVR